MLRGAIINLLVRSATARTGIACLAAVLLAWYVHIVISVWRADRLQDQGDEQSLEASAALQPWNAETHWLLGRYFLSAAQNSRLGLAHLNRAVELDPYEAGYWLDIAEAYQVKGEPAQSERALAQALQAEPTSPVIAWKCANFYLARNDVAHALPLLRVAIQYDPANTASALDLSWRATKSVHQIIGELPPDPAPYFALLNILIARNQPAQANELWHTLISRKLEFPVETAFPYFDYLIRTDQIDQAENVWTDLRRRDDSPPNLIRNSGFETEFLNGGFEWRYSELSQVDTTLDTREFHHGARSLRFTFLGPAVADTGVYEYVPVQPNTAYRLSAFAKTQEINTASGPRLAVEDSSTRKVLAATDEFQETSGWKQRTADFVTGPDTRLVTVRVVRIPGNLLIKGTLWLDDIELTPNPPAQSAMP